MRTFIGKILPAVVLLLAMLSCGSKKTVGEATSTGNLAKTTVVKKQGSENDAFMQRVLATRQTSENIVASADLSLVSGGKNMSCDGKLSMRRDKVIRLQLLLPIIRTEIARLDFTPDYVLLVDRYHKEYVKASYKDVSFLADNGISFYSLQALFWNELFLPGVKTVDASMAEKFGCNLAAIATAANIDYTHGNMTCKWTADKTTALIKTADVAYNSQKYGKSTLKWTYDNFRTVNGRSFPLTQQFGVQTNATGKSQSVQITVKMSSPKTSTDWDTETQLSQKYRKIEAVDIFKKIMSIQ